MTPMNVLCPTCRKPSAWEGNPFRPFCSERCRLLDLGKWLDEEYRIEGAPDETDEDEPEQKEEPDRDD